MPVWTRIPAQREKSVLFSFFERTGLSKLFIFCLIGSIITGHILQTSQVAFCIAVLLTMVPWQDWQLNHWIFGFGGVGVGGTGTGGLLGSTIGYQTPLISW
jgi:hypothetical protein